MEVIIAVAVFSVAMLIATGVFLLATQAQRRTSAEQTLQSDARYVLETLTRAVKYGTVDYTCYETNVHCDPLAGTLFVLDDTNGATNVLALRDLDGNRTRYRVFADGLLYVCTIKAAGDPADYCDNPPGAGTNPEAWQPLTPAGITVSQASFTVHPFRDPAAAAGGEFLSNDQPRVTIGYTAEQIGAQEQDDRITLQTTITSRTYAR